MPTNAAWFNARAARARLEEIDAEVVRLQQEQTLLRSLLGSRDGATADAARVPRGSRRRRATGEPTLAGLLVETMSVGTRGKAWEVGELVAALKGSHPDRLPPGNKASALVAATLAQDRRAKTPLFVARKGRGRRSNLYRLAQ